MSVHVSIEQEELRGISRTVAEIHWLLLILILLYLIFGGVAKESEPAISSSLFFYAALVMAFRYANFFRTESRWKIAVETWAMIAVITWALWFTGGLRSPLLNAYLLVVITSALTLGKLTTLVEVALIAACYVFLAGASYVELASLAFVGALAAQFAPVVLVAYITTMFSADIRYALQHIADVGREHGGDVGDQHHRRELRRERSDKGERGELDVRHARQEHVARGDQGHLDQRGELAEGQRRGDHHQQVGVEERALQPAGEPQRPGDDGDHRPGLDRDLPAALGAEEIGVAERHHQRGVEEQRRRDRRLALLRHAAEDQVEQDQDQQQPVDLGHGARDAAEFLLLDRDVDGHARLLLRVLSIAMETSANGLRVLVTAGGAGIGRVIARTFVDHGARVHVCDVDEKALKQSDR